MTSESTPLASLSAALADAVTRNAPSLVTVNARRRLPASGIVWSADGAILTADHVIEREEGIEVRLDDGRVLDAALVGRDPGSDLAVLRVGATGLAPVSLAPAESLRVGNIVLALGRPAPDGPMASFGVVSTVGGPWRTRRGGEVEGYIRSDTTLFPGFSGGPLVDAEGLVVGLNSSRLGRGNGLSVPVSAMTRIAGDLLARGRVRRAFLGISSQVVRLSESLSAGLDGQEAGLLITAVEAASPAGEAGLLVGDILVTFAGEALTDTDDLQSLLGPARIGQAVPARVVRGGNLTGVTITVGERP